MLRKALLACLGMVAGMAWAEAQSLPTSNGLRTSDPPRSMPSDTVGSGGPILGVPKSAPNTAKKNAADRKDDDKNQKETTDADKDKDKEEESPKHIKDNSFLIEEAYNQEAGQVQHIFNWLPQWFRDSSGHRREFVFTYVIELPICSQCHQFSFNAMALTNVSDHPRGAPVNQQGGFGDFLVNYRYQLLLEDENGWRPAVAPRFSLVLPTADKDRDLGPGELGYQFNLPVSKEMDPFAFHFNAGFTYFPKVSTTLPNGLESPRRSLRGYNLGASVIWLATYEFNLLVELVALWDEDLDDVGFRTRSKEVVVNPGFRYAIYTDDSVQWVVGVGVPIGLSRDAPDVSIFGYLSVEHVFKKQPKKESGNGNGDKS